MGIFQRFQSLRLGMRLGLVCAAAELLFLGVVLGSILIVSNAQIERYNQQRAGEIRHLLSTMFADALVRKDSAEILDVATRLTDGNSDLVMLEVRNISGAVLAQRGMPLVSAGMVVDTAIEIGGQSYGQVRFVLSDQAMKQERLFLLAWIGLLGGLAILLSMGLFLIIGHVMTARLRELSQCAKQIAAGDYQLSLPATGTDEVGHLRDAFAAMIHSLKERIDELTQAKSAAEAANNAKTMFLANMSHELRTPLSAVIGMAGIAAKRAVDDKQRDQLDKVIHAGRHLNNIVTDVLDISRLDRGALRLDCAPFTLETLVCTLHGLFDTEAEKKHLEFLIRIDPEIAGLGLMGDVGHIARALSNLVGNAIKFTWAGSVSVSIECVEDAETRAKLRFEVSDTGIGIESEDMERVFHNFEQADGSMTRQYGGVGLGLPISRGLVNLMGGTLRVASSPEQGSRFWFEISLDKAVSLREINR